MALARLQRRVCRLISTNRIEIGESYVAGGAALGEALATTRLSRDIDLFHDTAASVDTAFESDCRLLAGSGLGVETLRRRAGFAEALVRDEDEAVLLEWAADSAFRFFPLMEHPEFGLVLHPFDLATNKVLALVGRVEVRDWVDVLACDSRLQPFGYLAWAASGKDPGFSPLAILEEAARTARYSALEVESLDFDGERPDAGVLARQWRTALAEARSVVAALPPEVVGTCVLEEDGDLFRGNSIAAGEAAAAGRIRFHPGSIKGAFPRLVPVSPAMA